MLNGKPNHMVRILRIFYTSKELLHVEAVHDNLVYCKQFNKEYRSINSPTFAVQLDGFMLKLLYTEWEDNQEVDKTNRVDVGGFHLSIEPKHEHIANLIVNGGEFTPMEIINAGEYSRENGGYLQEVSFSKQKFINTFVNNEFIEEPAQELLLSIAGDTILVNGYSVPVSDRHSLSLSFKLDAEVTFKALSLLTGNVARMAIPTEEDVKSIILSGKDDYCIIPIIAGSYHDRLKMRDESHKEGGFTCPLVTDKGRKPIKINRFNKPTKK